MFIDRVEVTFDAGHRLLNYQGKCASPHGHTFRAEIVVAADELNELGLAVDFGDVKSVCKRWIDEHWDHGFLANDQDVVLVQAFRSIPEAKLYLFQGANPSAETMAHELYGVLASQGWRTLRVRIWESLTQYAEYVPDDVPAHIRRQQQEVFA